MDRIDVFLDYLIEDIKSAKRTLILQKLFDQIKK